MTTGPAWSAVGDVPAVSGRDWRQLLVSAEWGAGNPANNLITKQTNPTATPSYQALCNNARGRKQHLAIEKFTQMTLF